jgi:thiol-disulfide isomerase/thioredoxin
MTLHTSATLVGVAVMLAALWASVVTTTRVLAREAAGEPRQEVVTLPAARAGQDVVGTKLPDLAFDQWLPDQPVKDEARPPVTLYRWWTDGCPFCEKTLPAVETLREKYEKQGLRVVAVYHPKPVRPVEKDAVRRAAERLGFHGTIAVDEDWSELKRACLGRSKTARATSVSLLVDRNGTVRFVHPGTQYFPSEEPGEKQENDDYRLLDRAIAALLEE